MYKSPILPIGSVNLTTGQNTGRGAMFETIWECWEERPDCSNILVQETTTNKLRAVHTADTFENATKNYPIGSPQCFCHDQTRANMGYMWKVLGVFRHSPEGLLEMKKVAGKPSVAFATFK